MKKARILVPLAVILTMMSAAAVFAQQAAPPAHKIAIINSAQAFETSAEGKKAYAQFQERDSKIKADIQRLDAAITALQNRMSTGRLTMTQEALAATQADIDKKTTERKRYEEDATRDFQQFQATIVQRIRNEMVTIIQALRKEKGLEFVLDLQTSGIVDFDPTMDITDEVVKRYDATKAALPPVKK
jgi:outer membrane protein